MNATATVAVTSDEFLTGVLAHLALQDVQSLNLAERELNSALLFALDVLVSATTGSGTVLGARHRDLAAILGSWDRATRMGIIDDPWPTPGPIVIKVRKGAAALILAELTGGPDLYLDASRAFLTAMPMGAAL